MIADLLQFLPNYLPPVVWKAVQPFIERCNSELPLGKHVLLDRDIFANASSYNTVPVHASRFEAHKKYVDIQIMLSGSEIIEVVPLSAITPAADYDLHNDVQFFSRPAADVVRIPMFPGRFAVFFPQDAHCPQISPAADTTLVKKTVIKLKTGLFDLPHV